MIPLPSPEDPKVKFRVVLNDVCVGPWYDVDFPVFPPTIDGLKEALSRPEMVADGWDASILAPGGWDPHLVNHGLRLQFWVPLPSEASAATAACEMAKAIADCETDIAQSDLDAV